MKIDSKAKEWVDFVYPDLAIDTAGECEENVDACYAEALANLLHTLQNPAKPEDFEDHRIAFFNIGSSVFGSPMETTCICTIDLEVAGYLDEWGNRTEKGEAMLKTLTS